MVPLLIRGDSALVMVCLTETVALKGEKRKQTQRLSSYIEALGRVTHGTVAVILAGAQVLKRYS